MYLDGRRLRHRNRRGEPIVDDSFLLLLHAGDADITFALPRAPWADSYAPVVDTTNPGGAPTTQRVIRAGAPLPLTARSVTVLRILRRASR